MKKRVLFGIVALIAAFSIIGCKDNKDDEEENKDPFVLTLTGTLPTETGHILVASLVNTDESIAAVAMFATGGKFTFYEPAAGIPTPDNTKPFSVKGSYLVALAKASYAQEVKGAWIYAQNNQPTPVSVSGDFTLDYNDFIVQDASGYAF